MHQENNDSKICPICGRPTHKESQHCIFHAVAEEKTEKEFKKALKEYINEIKEKKKDFNFKRFIFIGDINFRKDLNITVFKNAFFLIVTFKGSVSFQEATFEGSVSFQEATFEGSVSFQEATFEKRTSFQGATFERSVSFQEATFERSTSFQEANFAENADFMIATFKGNAHFQKATFEGYAIFSEAIFERDANFENATIKGDAYFCRATFERYTYFNKAIFERDANFENATIKGDAYFNKATFEGDAYFKLKCLSKTINFSEIKIFPGKILSIKINNEGAKIYFERTYLENIDLEMELVKNTLISFTGVLLKNTKIKKGQIENHILQEEKKEFFEAQKIYLLLKNNFHTIGQYEDESWAFKKEKDMERLSQSFPYYKATLKNENKKESLPFLKWIQKGNFKKWITSAFSNMIYGYGEKPWNVIKTAVAIILIFALSFSFIGLGNPEIIELKGTASHQNSGDIVDLASKGFLKNNVIRNFPDSLYFSTITFTTLGYGDFRPLEGWGRILAGSEAFIGAFMMALFVYTFARRTGGR